MIKIKKIKDRKLTLYRALTITQGEKDGGPVLRGEGSWLKWNGLLVSTKKGTWYIGFRRHGLWLKRKVL